LPCKTLDPRKGGACPSRRIFHPRHTRHRSEILPLASLGQDDNGDRRARCSIPKCHPELVDGSVNAEPCPQSKRKLNESSFLVLFAQHPVLLFFGSFFSSLKRKRNKNHLTVSCPLLRTKRTGPRSPGRCGSR
jgi:hypothetical protein